MIHRWILSRLQNVVREVKSALDGYLFNQYAHVLYQFFWHEYCDWYLEMIKPDLYGEDRAAKRLAQSLSARVLEQMLILLHPVMPFVTEEIWQKLPQTSGSIMKAALPAIEDDRLDPDAEEAMELIMGW